MLRITAAVASLVLAACAGGSTATPTPASAGSTDPPSDEATPAILGLRLGASLADVRADVPDLEMTGTVGTAQLIRDGVEWRAHLTFHEDRLAVVSVHTNDASIEAYHDVVAALEARLGAGEPTICASEVGPELAPYLASGRGSMRTRWEDDALRGNAHLAPLTTGALQLQLYFEHRELADRHRPSPEFKGGRAKQAASACPEIGSPPPRVLGLAFGASPEDVARALGTDADLSEYPAVVPHRLGGVDGELHLRFYDGCLAGISFHAAGSIDGYRAVQSAVLPQMAEPERREQCSPTGDPPTDAQIDAGRGYLQTLWQDDPIRGSLRLAPPVGDDPARVTFEASAEALSGRAPSIDFGG